MNVAIIGSRSITDIDLSQYLSGESNEIISGGAKGIVEQCDILIAIWDGVSHGTKYAIEYARKLQKVYV